MALVPWLALVALVAAAAALIARLAFIAGVGQDWGCRRANGQRSRQDPEHHLSHHVEPPMFGRSDDRHRRAALLITRAFSPLFYIWLWPPGCGAGRGGDTGDANGEAFPVPSGASGSSGMPACCSSLLAEGEGASCCAPTASATFVLLRVGRGFSHPPALRRTGGHPQAPVRGEAPLNSPVLPYTPRRRKRRTLLRSSWVRHWLPVAHGAQATRYGSMPLDGWTGCGVWVFGRPSLPESEKLSFDV